MKKVILFFVFILLSKLTTFAQTETLTGQILKKEWSKTIDSYCAGGSEYYVLVADDKSETILDLSNWRKKRIEKTLNKTISLKGVWKKETKQSNDPYSQHPISPTACRIFVVEK